MTSRGIGKAVWVVHTATDEKGNGLTWWCRWLLECAVTGLVARGRRGRVAANSTIFLGFVAGGPTLTEILQIKMVES